MNASERVMPTLDAYRVPALRGTHYRATFPDGEVTYPSRESMTRAASRIGAAVRFHEAPTSTKASRDLAVAVAGAVTTSRDAGMPSPMPEIPPSASGTAAVGARGTARPRPSTRDPLASTTVARQPRG